MFFDPVAPLVAPPEGFWNFQAKDAVTAVIGLAAFVTSVTNLWVAYLRRQRVRCEVGDVLRMGYGPRPERLLMMKLDVYALNTGARPGVVTRMAIEIRSSEKVVSTLPWTEVGRTTNIAPPGQLRKIWTDFGGFATPILIPKYDAKLVEAVFNAEKPFEFVAGVQYSFRLVCRLANRRKPIKGEPKLLVLKQADTSFLDKYGTTTNNERRHLTAAASDGRNFSCLPIMLPPDVPAPVPTT